MTLKNKNTRHRLLKIRIIISLDIIIIQKKRRGPMMRLPAFTLENLPA